MSLEFMADSCPKSLKGFEQSTADDSQNQVISVVKNIFSHYIVLNTASSSSSSPDSLKMENVEHPRPAFGWQQEGRLENTSRLKENERGKALKTLLKVDWGAHCCSGISDNKDSSTTYITDNKMTRREQKIKKKKFMWEGNKCLAGPRCQRITTEIYIRSMKSSVSADVQVKIERKMY